MKIRHTTTIAVDIETSEILHRLADEKNMSLKDYLRAAAKYIEKTHIDVTENVSVVQEIKKSRDQFVSFQRNFEKTKLQPLLDNLGNLLIQFSDFKQKNSQELNAVSKELAMLREAIEKQKNAQNEVSILSEKCKILLQRLEKLKALYTTLKKYLLQALTEKDYQSFAEYMQQVFEAADSKLNSIFEV